MRNILNMYEHGKNGKLITFCGLDGSGKTTILYKVANALKEKGKNVFLTRQPTDYVRQSDIFRTYMDTPVHDDFDYRSLSLLAASDRIQHSNKTIMKELEKENVVISDRYFYSCLANLRARGYKSDRWIYDIAKNIPKPDYAFFIDVPADIAILRVRNREEEKDRYIDIDLQYRLRDEYLQIAKANSGIIISSLCGEEETFMNVLKHIDKELATKSDEEEKVFKLITDLSGYENCALESNLTTDIGLDSLARVSLIVETEIIFGIKLKESDLNPFALITVNDVVNLVKKYTIASM